LTRPGGRREAFRMQGNSSWLRSRSPGARLAGLPLVLVLTGGALTACMLDENGLARPPATTTSPSGGGEGGAGGGAGGTGGGGAGGGGEPGVLAQWTAGEPDPDTGTYTLPGWLVLESPSENKTAQVGPGALRTGFGPDAARARSVDGVAWGLAVEGERTNRMLNARVAQPGWTLINGATLAKVTGPDGADLAATVTDVNPSLVASAYEQFQGMPGEAATFSAWVTTEDSEASLECNSFPLGSPDTYGVTVPPSSGWQRVSLTGVEQSGAASLLRLEPASDGSMAVGSTTFDLVSIETGRYPSSVILTEGDPVTRKAERLHVATPSDVAPGGWFHVTLVVAPHYASGEQAGEHDLLWFDGLNRLYLRADGAVALQAEGSDALVTAPLTWKRDQALTIEVKSAPSGRSLRVAGAEEGEVSDEDPSGIALPLPVAKFFVLGSDIGSQEGADLREITFFPPM